MVHLTSYDVKPSGKIKAVPQTKSHEASTRLEHLCLLHATSPVPQVRLTGIICSIGPASYSVDMLEKMMAAGMNIARLNFSHGKHEYHSEAIANIRKAADRMSAKLGYEFPVGIALDTKGPEIRSGLIKGSITAEIELKTGDSIRVTTNIDYRENCSNEILWIDYKNVINCIKPDDHIFVDYGSISLKVKDIRADLIMCTVEVGGSLGSNRTIHIPGIGGDLPSVSSKDKSDFQFGIQEGIDMIFASFIRQASALKEIRLFLGERGKNIQIISKIENYQGIENIDEIIAASDGIMLARGDLGIEIPLEKIFIAQKYIIAKCNILGVPVICSSQMLDSMIKKSRATRAELSDVANAVLDGADCLMLTGETAKGYFPIESILTMARVCKEAEGATLYKHFLSDLMTTIDLSTFDAPNAVALSAVDTANKSNSKAIIVITTSGKTAYLISKFRPKCPIIAVTRDAAIARQCHLYRGIIPLVFQEPPMTECYKDVDVRVQFAMKFARDNTIASHGDPVVVFTVVKQGSKYTNTLRVISAE